MKTFSIVVPVYFNEANLPDTVPELLSLGARLEDVRLELVFVDDGSQDRSFEQLTAFQQQHPETIKVVQLSRNFGSMAAIQAGLTVATGDCVGVIAADLQDPPELFLEMIQHWKKGSKTVFAVRSDREESFGQKAFSNVYYALLRRFALPGYPEGGFDFLLMDRQVVNELNAIHEKNTNLMSLVFWLGHRPVMIPYVRRRRTKGSSRWTLAKKVKLFIDSFVAFSYVPIRAVSMLGVGFALGSFLYGLVVLLSWLGSGTEVRGWTALMMVLTFTSGVQMIILGVLGEYLWRSLDAARARPMYVIDRIISSPAEAEPLRLLESQR